MLRQAKALYQHMKLKHNGGCYGWHKVYFKLPLLSYSQTRKKAKRYALSGEHAANLVRYCGTRETVEKNIDMADDLPITFKQKVSVKDLLNLCTEKGLSAECEEYKAYETNPTRANASSLMLHLANKLSENTSLNLSEQNIVNEAIRLAQFYDVKNRPATKKQKETIKVFSNN